MSQQNVTAIRALYEAFNRGDFETMKRGFNTDFERFEPENSLYAEGNPYRGFEGSRDGVYAPRMPAVCCGPLPSRSRLLCRSSGVGGCHSMVDLGLTSLTIRGNG